MCTKPKFTLPTILIIIHRDSGFDLDIDGRFSSQPCGCFWLQLYLDSERYVAKACVSN